MEALSPPDRVFNYSRGVDPDLRIASSGLFRQSARVRSLNHNAKRLLER